MVCENLPRGRPNKKKKHKQNLPNLGNQWLSQEISQGMSLLGTLDVSTWSIL